MTGLAFPAREYRSRQTAFLNGLAAAGLDGALVVSRGGSTLDRYAQLLYLTGHYQHYSYLPDEAGLFSARAHAALVMSASGAILCVSVAEIEPDEVVASDIRHSADFIATVAGAVASLGLQSKRLGLVGADVLPLRYWRDLDSRIPQATWSDCDAILDRMRRIKSAAEIEVVREAAAVHRRATTALIERVAAGRTEADLAAALAQSAMADGCGLYFTSISSGTATRRWTSQSLPGFSTRTLRQGDLLRFDTGIVHRGYLSDFGRSLVVGSPSAAQRRLIETLHHGLDAVIEAIAPGVPVRRAVAAGEAALTRLGVGSPEAGAAGLVSSFPIHWGHGLGLGFERPWLTENEDLIFEPGMVIAVERALTMPSVGTAAAEQNLLIGATGVELLTGGSTGPWS